MLAEEAEEREESWRGSYGNRHKIRLYSIRPLTRFVCLFFLFFFYLIRAETQ